MPRLFTKGIAALTVANIATLVLGIAVAFCTGDGHMAQRTGAAIAAITGLFVVWQVVDEIRMERALEHAAPEPSTGFPLDNVAERLTAARTARRGSAIHQARLLMVAAIAFWLCVGEVLHGFGDLLVPSPGSHDQNH